jgi:diguanylate cyclase (GGDEF)-like protein
MKLFGSLQARITALYTAAFGAVLILVALSMNWAIARSAEDKVLSELDSSSHVIDRIWELREQQMSAAARPLALDFGFREAVSSNDEETLRSALANIGSRISVPSVFVVTYDGRVIARNPENDRAYDAELWDRLDSGWKSGVLRIGGKTYQAVAADIEAPGLIGWLVIGRELDRGEMADLGKLSAIPVSSAVVRHDPRAGWVMDATGRPVSAGVRGLLDDLARSSNPQGPALSRKLGGKIALAHSLGMTDGKTDAALLLDFAVADALSQYDGLRWAVAIAGGLGMLIVGFASLWLARRIVRPIAALESATRSIARGELAHVPVTSSDEIGALTGHFNEMAAAIGEREKHISYLAYHDALTELPNRLCLKEELDRQLQRAAMEDGRIAVLCLGLDDFKGVNDTLGHDTGDRLLVAVSHRLKDLAGDRFVARMGGDQFCLVAWGDVDSDRLGEDIVERLTTPFAIGDQRLRTGACVGVVDTEARGSVAEDLIKHAELAMFRAKEAGPSRCWRFTPELDRAARERRLIEADLHVALAEGQFELYFQPLYDLSTNRFSAFEALVRWNHPKKGLVGPVEFIPIAEDCGLIVPLGEWVLKEACRQAVTWPGDVRVAVNFSMVQFQSPGLMNTVVQALAMSGLAPNRLEAEITESLFLEDSGGILQTLKSLKDLGVRIALDDFGTGYSSLSYLRKFPVDKIKIDRSFIVELLHAPGARAVVRAITQLAAALDMETTAEGVEDSGQVEVLREHGCTNVQGYYFSQPVPAHRVIPLIQASEAKVAAASRNAG